MEKENAKGGKAKEN